MDTTPQNNLPAALTKQVDASTPPAEDRLSPMESPELAEVNGTTAEDRVKGPGNSATAAGTSESKTASAAAVKTKKKEDKSIEHILRSLSSLNSPEEKLFALCKKHADLLLEHQVLQTSQQRKMTVDQQEKDQLQAEHIKAVKAQSKLESMCRDLHKQNKAVKEESILRQKEEEKKRKEMSIKFQVYCSKPVPPSAPQDTTGPTTTTTTTSSQASTTVTPPNTPEENTSRASPNPDSPAASLPTPSLPTGQNGPVSPASSLPVPSSSTEEEAESELAGQGESCTTASTETSQSSSPDDSSVPAAAEITTTQQSDQAEASSSSSEQSVSPSAENEAV
ncbi:hypothetical protein ACOMHN_048357 [Nucella lapillus]